MQSETVPVACKKNILLDFGKQKLPKAVDTIEPESMLIDESSVCWKPWFSFHEYTLCPYGY